MMSGSASLTKRPCEVGDPLVEGAVEADRVLRASIPYCSPSRKSSSPKASAVWTRPVPSSVVTKSAEQDGVAARAVVGRRCRRTAARSATPVERRRPGSVARISASSPRTRSTERRGDDDDLAAGQLRPHVVDLGADGDRGVGDQRPRRRRPDQQLVAGLERTAVAVRRRERAAARRPTGRRRPCSRARPRARTARSRSAGSRGRPCGPRRAGPSSQICAQRPPDRLDVVVRRASRRGRRGRSRSRSARSAGSSPRRSSNTDSRQRWLNSAIPYASISCFELIPSSFSTSSSTGRPWQSQPPLRGTSVAAHRLVARVDVLEDAGEDVVGAGLAVRGRRALVEAPERPRPRGARASGGRRRARASARAPAPRARGRTAWGRPVRSGSSRRPILGGI